MATLTLSDGTTLTSNQTITVNGFTYTFSWQVVQLPGSAGGTISSTGVFTPGTSSGQSAIELSVTFQEPNLLYPQFTDGDDEVYITVN